MEIGISLLIHGDHKELGSLLSLNGRKRRDEKRAEAGESERHGEIEKEQRKECKR